MQSDIFVFFFSPKQLEKKVSTLSQLVLPLTHLVYLEKVHLLKRYKIKL